MFTVFGSFFAAVGLAIVGRSIYNVVLDGDTVYERYLRQLEIRNMVSDKPYKSPKDRDKVVRTHRINAIQFGLFGLIFALFGVGFAVFAANIGR